MLRNIHFLVLVTIIVALFGALHPVLNAAGLCGSGGCPETVEHSPGVHTGFSLVCIAAMIPASGVAMFAFVSFLLGRRSAEYFRPHELYLSPDTPPPRISLYG